MHASTYLQGSRALNQVVLKPNNAAPGQDWPTLQPRIRSYWMRLAYSTKAQGNAALHSGALSPPAMQDTAAEKK